MCDCGQILWGGDVEKHRTPPLSLSLGAGEEDTCARGGGCVWKCCVGGEVGVTVDGVVRKGLVKISGRKRLLLHDSYPAFVFSGWKHLIQEGNKHK